MKSAYEKVKEWRKNNPEKVAAQARRYNAKHPDKRKKIVERYRNNNIEAIRERDRLAAATKRKNDPEGQKIRNERYKIKKEAERWEIAGRPRSEICEICFKEELTVFDHCHSTGNFRGWICDRCNKILGLVYDSSELLIKLANYLEKNNGQINHKET